MNKAIFRVKVGQRSKCLWWWLCRARSQSIFFDDLL